MSSKKSGSKTEIVNMIKGDNANIQVKGTIRQNYQGPQPKSSGSGKVVINSVELDGSKLTAKGLNQSCKR